jgi:hypothetical protein
MSPGRARWPGALASRGVTRRPPPGGTLATRPTALLGAGRAGQSNGGVGAAVSQAYASALSALRNASFQCLPGRP